MQNKGYKAILTICVACLILLSGCTQRDSKEGVIVQKRHDELFRIQVRLNNGTTEWWMVDEGVYNALQIDEGITKSKDGHFSVG